jgi:apolipoprotein D and lipocalin family protein
MFFQRNCVANTTANYSINADKTVGVLNSCTNKKGEMISSEGVAYPQNEGNSKLKVSFYLLVSDGFLLPRAIIGF